MTKPFTLAHLSDIHLSPVAGFAFGHWNAKRVLGYLNWQSGRRGVHLRPALDKIIADVATLRTDHIAITGDLINLGLPDEYEAALAWLQSIGPPERVTVVPGNHDVYTRLKGHRGIARWAAYMGSEEETLAFPFVRRLGPLALIGMNSAVETPPFFASGRLGANQIELAGEMLQRLGEEGLVRVILIHHPPLPGLASPRRALQDAAQFAHVVEMYGAELVLHGHNHRDMLSWHGSGLQGALGAIPVIGVPSASAGREHKKEPLARYNVFTFFSTADGLRIRHAVRGLAAADGPVIKLAETVLELPS